MAVISNSINWHSRLKAILMLALPVLGAHVIEAIIPFFNVTLAASLGQESLAAAGLVSSTFLALMSFCWGIVAAVGIIAATKIGENTENKQIGITLWAGFVTTCLLSLPAMLILSYMPTIWLTLGQDPNVVQQATPYMNGMLYAVPADIAKFAIFQFAIACNRPRVPLIANIVSILLSIFLNTWLTHQLGILGIGLGTAITYWVVFLSMFTYVVVAPYFKKYLLHAINRKELLNSVYHQLKLGTPIGAMFSIELIFLMVFSLLIGRLGSLGLAANQIAMQWLWLTVMFAYGFTEAVTILAAKANGAKNYSAVIQYTFTGTLLSLCCIGLIACIYWYAPNLIMKVDLTNTNVNSSLPILTEKLLLLCGVYQLLDTVRIVVAGALRGIEDSTYPMVVSAIAFWLVALPLGYFCAFTLQMRETGLWIGLIAAALISSLLQCNRLRIYSARLRFSDSRSEAPVIG